MVMARSKRRAERGEGFARVCHDRLGAHLGCVAGADVEADKADPRMLEDGVRAGDEVGEAGADRDHDIGVARHPVRRRGPVHADRSERQLGDRRRALPGMGFGNRDARLPAEIGKRRLGRRVTDFAAGDEYRFRRRCNQFGRRGDLRRRRRSPHHRPHLPLEEMGGIGERLALHVLR